LLDRNRRGLRGALWIALSLYPLFGILDYLVAPREWLWLLYGTRAVVTVVTLVMLRVSNTGLFAAHPDAISSAYLVLASLGISLMRWIMPYRTIGTKAALYLGQYPPRTAAFGSCKNTRRKFPHPRSPNFTAPAFAK